MVGPTAPDEEGVAETVYVGDAEGVDLLMLRELAEEPLHAAADRAAEVEVGVEAGAAGQDKATEGFEVSVAAVHLGLECVDIGLTDARLAGMNILGQRGEDGAEVEEAVLDAAEDACEPCELRAVGLAFEGGEAGRADEGVELVDLAVAGNAGARLGNDLPADERGCALVTLAGVDAVDGDALSTTLVRLDGSIATSGADMNLSNIVIAIGAPTTIDSFTVTMPAS